MKQENKKNRASKHTRNVYNKNAHKNQGFSQVLQNFLSNVMIFFATNYTKMLFHLLLKLILGDDSMTRFLLKTMILSIGLKLVLNESNSIMLQHFRGLLRTRV